jgi:hypothetical protein
MQDHVYKLLHINAALQLLNTTADVTICDQGENIGWDVFTARQQNYKVVPYTFWIQFCISPYNSPV